MLAIPTGGWIGSGAIPATLLPLALEPLAAGVLVATLAASLGALLVVGFRDGVRRASERRSPLRLVPMARQSRNQTAGSDGTFSSYVFAQKPEIRF